MKLRFETSELAELSAHRRLGTVMSGLVKPGKGLVVSILYAALLVGTSAVAAFALVYAMSAFANGVVTLLLMWIGGLALLVTLPFVVVRSAVWLFETNRR